MREKMLMAAALFCAGVLFAGTTYAGESANIAVNGSFEEGLKGWSGQIVKNEKPEKDDSFLRLKESRKGGRFMVLNFDFAESGKFHTHNTGAIMRLSKKVQKGKTLQISFKAKWISGSKFLKVGRTWGGGDVVVELSKKTKTYKLTLKLPYETSDLIFNLSDSDKTGQRSVENGTVIIDDVKVVVLP